MRKEEVDYMKQHLETENARWSRDLVAVPKPWPQMPSSRQRIAVWRSNQFLVQVFEEAAGIVRLTVNRTTIDNFGNWRQDISWDDLQSGNAGSPTGSPSRFTLKANIS